MPTYSRRQIVVEDQVGVYHCIARCVRRAFLCGVDPYTGQDYSHRKEWILDRLRELAGLFAILSWFMRCLCEKIARAANHEDGSSGRFWAGRFKFKQAAGRPSSLVDAAARRSRRWFQGKAAARTAFV